MMHIRCSESCPIKFFVCYDVFLGASTREALENDSLLERPAAAVLSQIERQEYRVRGIGNPDGQFGGR